MPKRAATGSLYDGLATSADRLAAWCLDGLILGVCYSPVYPLVESQDPDPLRSILVLGGSVVFFYIYVIVC